MIDGSAPVVLAGGVYVGSALEDVLRFTGGSLDIADEARDLGLILIVGDGHVTAAHYMRPVERDAAGHLQRRPPALLSARDDEAGGLDHFHWAFTDELAARAGLTRAELEDEQAARARRLGIFESGIGPTDARH